LPLVLGGKNGQRLGVQKLSEVPLDFAQILIHEILSAICFSIHSYSERNFIFRFTIVDFDMDVISVLGKIGS